MAETEKEASAAAEPAEKPAKAPKVTEAEVKTTTAGDKVIPVPGKNKTKLIMILLVAGIAFMLLLIGVLAVLLFTTSGGNNTGAKTTVTPTVSGSTTPTVTVSGSVTPTVSTTTTPTLTPTVSAFSLTGLSGTAAEPAYSGNCPHTFNFTANVEVMNAGTVTYHWERSDGTNSPNFNINFTGSGSHSQNIDYSWSTGNPGENSDNYVKIVVTSPTSTSVTINFSAKCSLTGNWLIKIGPSNTLGTMILNQTGLNITGTYTNGGSNGTITAATATTSSNRVINGTWNINGGSGNFTWHLVSNSNTFKGSYSSGAQKWCGTYIGGTLPSDADCFQAP